MLKILATIILTLIPLVPKAPTLNHLGCGKYQAINPLRQSVIMTITCGPDFEPMQIKIAAGVSEELDIKEPDGDPGYCILASWTKT